MITLSRPIRHQVYVIRGDHVVEHTEAISLLCLKEPLEPGPPVSDKLQKKFFFFVATVDDLPREMRSIFHWGVPDVITWKVMPVCARHL
jgi:hypothetical protein